MSAVEPSAHRLSPALASFLIAMIALLTYGMLWMAARWSGADAEIPKGYPLWSAAATISFVVWLVVFLSGVRTVRREGGRTRRLPGWWWRSIPIYAGLAIAATGLLYAIALASDLAPGCDVRNDAPPCDDWGEPNAFRVIILVLTTLGWTAGAPWIMLVWITHEELRAMGGAVARIRSPAATDDLDPHRIDGNSLNDIAHRMDEVWRGIEGPSLALGLILSTLVLNTGTLRLVELDAGRPPATFPPYQVIAYGAFFALVAIAIIAPLVLEWRRRGLKVIAAALPQPLSGIPTEAHVSAANRLATRLGLDAPLLRRPITALGVLSPFVTAIVASLVPTS